MNKKNITYCSLAILTIVIIASTANGTSKNHKSANESSMTTKHIEQKKVDYSQEKLTKETESALINQSSSEKTSKSENKIFTESDKYTKTELNRALMYQNKSWAKDDTINEDAWIAAQEIDSSKSQANTTNIVTVKKQETNQIPYVISTQDSKNNSAMAD